MKTSLLISSSVWLVASAWAATTSSTVPTAFELLDQYAATQAKFQSYYEKYLITAVDTAGTQVTSRETWYDGCRARQCSQSWGVVSANLPAFTRQKPYREGKLWDGHFFFSGGWGAPGHAQGFFDIRTLPYPPNSKELSDFVSRLQEGSFMGRFWGDPDRVDAVLKQATNLQVRPRLERLSDSDCHVIEGTTPYGRYTLWLDPAHGCHIAQAIVDRRAGDRVAFGNGYVVGPTERFHLELRNVRFTQVQGVWTPMETDAVNGREGVPVVGQNVNGTARIHLKRTQFILNPDHSALRSFLPTDILDGAWIGYAADQSPANSLGRQPFVWQAGRVIDADGKVVLDSSLTTTNSNPRRDLR